MGEADTSPLVCAKADLRSAISYQSAYISLSPYETQVLGLYETNGVNAMG